MREELKNKIKEILDCSVLGSVPSTDALTNKIADLVDRDQQIPIGDPYDSLFASFDKLDQALDEHFAVLDKIKDALSTTPKAEVKFIENINQLLTVTKSEVDKL